MQLYIQSMLQIPIDLMQRCLRIKSKHNKPTISIQIIFQIIFNLIEWSIYVYLTKTEHRIQYWWWQLISIEWYITTFNMFLNYFRSCSLKFRNLLSFKCSTSIIILQNHFAFEYYAYNSTGTHIHIYICI